MDCLYNYASRGLYFPTGDDLVRALVGYLGALEQVFEHTENRKAEVKSLGHLLEGQALQCLGAGWGSPRPRQCGSGWITTGVGGGCHVLHHVQHD